MFHIDTSKDFWEKGTFCSYKNTWELLPWKTCASNLVWLYYNFLGMQWIRFLINRYHFVCILLVRHIFFFPNYLNKIMVQSYERTKIVLPAFNSIFPEYFSVASFSYDLFYPYSCYFKFYPRSSSSPISASSTSGSINSSLK